MLAGAVPVVTRGHDCCGCRRSATSPVSQATTAATAAAAAATSKVVSRSRSAVAVAVDPNPGNSVSLCLTIFIFRTRDTFVSFVFFLLPQLHTACVSVCVSVSVSVTLSLARRVETHSYWWQLMLASHRCASSRLASPRHDVIVVLVRVLS